MMSCTLREQGEDGKPTCSGWRRKHEKSWGPQTSLRCWPQPAPSYLLLEGDDVTPPSPSFRLYPSFRPLSVFKMLQNICVSSKLKNGFNFRPEKPQSQMEDQLDVSAVTETSSWESRQKKESRSPNVPSAKAPSPGHSLNCFNYLS